MKNKNFYNRNKYFLTAILFFILDFGLTWYFINYYPHASEGNPLFNIDGGYIALALNFIYLLLISILERRVIRKYETIMLDGNNTFDYMKKLMHSDKYSFIITSFVYAFIISTLASRLTAIIDWLIFGIYKSNFEQTYYALLRSKMPLQRFDPIVMIIVFLISLILWYKFEFKKTKRAQ